MARGRFFSAPELINYRGMQYGRCRAAGPRKFVHVKRGARRGVQYCQLRADLIWASNGLCLGAARARGAREGLDSTRELRCFNCRFQHSSLLVASQSTNRFKTVPRTATRIVVAQDLNATQLSVTGQRLRGRGERRAQSARATANSPVTCVEGQQAEHGHQMIHSEVPLS